MLTEREFYGFITNEDMEQQNQQYQAPQQQPASVSPLSGSDIGFPPPPKKQGSQIGKWAIAIGGALLIIGIGGWVVFKGMNTSDETNPSPTPESDTLSAIATPDPTSTPEPSATPKAEVLDKSKIKVEILNGTGKAGEASFLKAELVKLGFKDITASNAETQDETFTTIVFNTSSNISEAVVDEITKELGKLYNEVKTKKRSLDGADISITTGPRKGTSASATPSSTPAD